MADQVSDSQEAQDVRAKTKAIAERAKSDSSFAQQLKDDPINTLKAEGLPEKAIGELASKATGGDVSAYTIYAEYTCYYVTDLVTTEYYCTWFTS